VLAEQRNAAQPGSRGGWPSPASSPGPPCHARPATQVYHMGYPIPLLHCRPQSPAPITCLQFGFQEPGTNEEIKKFAADRGFKGEATCWSNESGMGTMGLLGAESTFLRNQQQGAAVISLTPSRSHSPRRPSSLPPNPEPITVPPPPSLPQAC
jgi:hypothetical protein